MAANQLLIPNTCQIPNIILDEIMPKISHAEFKVVMAIARKTYGWRKMSDRISLRQLMAMTGVSNRRVIDAIRTLDWLILTHKTESGGVEYSLNIDAEKGLLGGELSSQGSGETISPGGEASSQGVVKPVHQSGETSSPTTPTNNTHSTKEEEISSKKKKSSKETPDPRVVVFLKWWCERYKQVVKDEYMVQWGKEGAIVKRLLQQPLEEVKRRAERLLATTDRWLRQHRTIPMLSSKWNELGQQGAFESEQEGPSMRVL